MSELEKFDKLIIWSIGFQKIDFEGIGFFHNSPEINDQWSNNKMVDDHTN